jgi:hypothetical protein
MERRKKSERDGVDRLLSKQVVPGYQVRPAHPLPPLTAGWDDPLWARAETAGVTHFRPESSAHRPQVRVRLLHGADGLRGIFRVDDQYVRSIRTGFQSEVYKDSCVEFFMQPRPDRGYFNLEMNAGGSHLSYYVEDPARLAGGGLKKFTALTAEEGGRIQVRSSLPAAVDPEVREPLSWQLNFFVPLAVLEKYVGPLASLTGQTWRGNFYKCAEDVSHPHWASWAPVDELNFHLPRCFGRIQFL